MQKRIFIIALFLSGFYTLQCSDNLSAEEAFQKGKGYFKKASVEATQRCT